MSILNEQNKPTDKSKPFWAYGLFKPGELGFIRIKKFVCNCIDKNLPGQLGVVDGIPLFKYSRNTSEEVKGTLIFFNNGEAEEAYKVINDIEPEKYYKWTEYEEMNILESRLQKQDLFIIDEWSCDTDPYFREGFEILEEMLKSNTPKILCSTQDSTKRFLQLNMAYMLLWSMIDRYVTLRYHMLNRISDSEDSDYLEIANDKVFQKESDSFSPSRNKIFKSNSPDNYQYYNKRNDSDENNYKNRLKYFHQIRNNIVHRGKAYNNDIKLVYESLNGLLKIYKKVYKNALEESKWDN